MALIGIKRRKRDGYDGVWDWEFENDGVGNFRYVERHSDDYLDFMLTGFVFPASEERERIEIPNLPPLISMKFPKLPGLDPVKRRKVWQEIRKEGVERFDFGALEEAIHRGKQEAVLVAAIKDVNLGSEAASCCGEPEVWEEIEIGGSDSDSDSDNNNMVVDQGTGSSSHHLHSRL